MLVWIRFPILIYRLYFGLWLLKSTFCVQLLSQKKNCLVPGRFQVVIFVLVMNINFPIFHCNNFECLNNFYIKNLWKVQYVFIKIVCNKNIAYLAFFSFKIDYKHFSQKFLYLMILSCQKQKLFRSLYCTLLKIIHY